MEIDFEKGNVKIYDKTTKFQTLVNKFSTLSGSQIYGFFKNRNVLPPRRINVLALRAVLNEKIKYLNSNSLSKDYFQRLQGYEYFTEHQLYTLFLKIANDKESFKEYKNNYFTLILLNYNQLALTDGELSYIRNLNKDGNESFEQYFNYITGASIEMLNNFDGVDIDILKDKLCLTASNQEIREIALKYGIDIPSKLTKEEMIDFIANSTNTSEEDIDNFKAELSIKTLNELNDYSNENNLGVTSDLTKQSLVNYLFYYLSRCNIETSLIKEIITDSLGDSQKYEPLVFKVELGILSGFKSRKPEKIIHYEGEDNDMDKYNQNLDSKNIDDEEIEEIPEVLEEESNTDEALDSITGDVIENNENIDEELDSITDDVIEEEQSNEEVNDEVITEPANELSSDNIEDNSEAVENTEALENTDDENLDLNTDGADEALDSITGDVIEDENDDTSNEEDDNLDLNSDDADDALDSITDDIIEENEGNAEESQDLEAQDTEVQEDVEENLDAQAEEADEATEPEESQDLEAQDTESQDDAEDNFDAPAEEADEATEPEESQDLEAQDNETQEDAKENLDAQAEETDEVNEPEEPQDLEAQDTEVQEDTEENLDAQAEETEEVNELEETQDSTESNESQDDKEDLLELLAQENEQQEDNQDGLVNNGEELTNEQIEELVKQAQENEVVKEEIKENPNKEFISNVEINDMYGSKKMASIAKFSVGKIIAVSILGTIALALIIFFIVGLLR